MSGLFPVAKLSEMQKVDHASKTLFSISEQFKKLTIQVREFYLNDFDLIVSFSGI